MQWLTEFAKFIQQTEKTWFGLCLASATLTFFPQLAISGDKTDKVYAYYGLATTTLFVLSAAILVSAIGCYVGDSIRYRRAENAKIKALKILTPPERKLLRQYLDGQTKSIDLDPRDPTVTLLVQRQWLIPPGSSVGVVISASMKSFGVPHILEDWVYAHLKAHPELIA